ESSAACVSKRGFTGGNREIDGGATAPARGSSIDRSHASRPSRIRRPKRASRCTFSAQSSGRWEKQMLGDDARVSFEIEASVIAPGADAALRSAHAFLRTIAANVASSDSLSLTVERRVWGATRESEQKSASLDELRVDEFFGDLPRWRYGLIS